MKNNNNPEWNEELTLSITDLDVPIKLVSDSCIIMNQEFYEKSIKNFPCKILFSFVGSF